MSGGGGCPAGRAAGDANSGENGVGGGARIRPGPGVGDANGAAGTPPPAADGERSMPTGGGPVGGGPVGGGPALGPDEGGGGGGVDCAAASCSRLSCASHSSAVMVEGIHA